MHPFYGPSARLVGRRESSLPGLVSMAAYLAFWAVAIAVAKHELDARFPRPVRPPAGADPAVALLRERLARGEIDVDDYRDRLTALTALTAPTALSDFE
jgi:putative membrane protein